MTFGMGLILSHWMSILEQFSHPKFFSVSIGVGFDPTEFRPQMGP